MGYVDGSKVKILHVLEGLAMFEKKKDNKESKNILCVGENMDLQKNMRHERKFLDNGMDGRKIKTHSNLG